MSWYAAPRSRFARLSLLADPWVRATIVLIGTACVGFAMFGLAWRGAARTIYVPFQLPWLISAGMAGGAMIGTALGALTIHVGRRQDAATRAVVEDIVATAVELADDIRAGRRTLRRR